MRFYVYAWDMSTGPTIKNIDSYKIYVLISWYDSVLQLWSNFSIFFFLLLFVHLNRYHLYKLSLSSNKQG